MTSCAAFSSGALAAASAGQEDDTPGAPVANGQAAEPRACLAGGRRDAAAAQGQAVPACVMIMWGDGTVTTVRAPDTAPAEAPPPDGTFPGAAFPG